MFHDLVQWLSMPSDTMHVHCPVARGYEGNVSGEACSQINNEVRCFSLRNSLQET